MARYFSPQCYRNFIQLLYLLQDSWNFTNFLAKQSKADRALSAHKGSKKELRQRSECWKPRKGSRRGIWKSKRALGYFPLLHLSHQSRTWYLGTKEKWFLYILFMKTPLSVSLWENPVYANLEPGGPASAGLSRDVCACVHTSGCRSNSLHRTWEESLWYFSCLTWQCFHSNGNLRFWIWILFGTGSVRKKTSGKLDWSGLGKESVGPCTSAVRTHPVLVGHMTQYYGQ